LSWIPHIQSITTKISKNIGIIAKSHHSLDRSTLSVLYNSLILPYLQYCTIIWGSSYTTHLHPLLQCQKKVMRIIMHSPPLTLSKPLFKELNILTVFQIYEFQLSCFIFRHLNNLLPSPISCLFEFNYNIHDHFTFTNMI
jgi:hypothetical protein